MRCFPVVLLIPQMGTLTKVINDFPPRLEGSDRGYAQHLSEELAPNLNSKERGRLVDLRNSLVHNGTYPSNYSEGGWDDDYQFAIWVDFIALCRLAGYDGTLPIYRVNRRLQVAS